MTDDDIKTLIEPLLIQALDGDDYQSVEVRSGEDHDGDPVLFIEIRLGPEANFVGGTKSNALGADLWRLLIGKGETRFPHKRYIFPTDKRSKQRLREQMREALGV